MSIVFILLVALVAPAPPARADSASLVAHLPFAREGAAAVSDGSVVYLLGGETQVNGVTYVDQILKFDPATNAVTDTGVKLPFAMGRAPAVWTGSAAFVFFAGATVKFDPVAGTAVAMTSPPVGLQFAAAVWTGQYAYIFGGWGFQYSNQILRYDPLHDTMTAMNATLPVPLASAAAAWDGSLAFIFGGCVADAVFNGDCQGTTDQIEAYDPVLDAIIPAEGLLPSPSARTAAVWDGTQATIFGAIGAPDIVRYDPNTHTATASDAQITPGGRLFLAAAQVGANAFVLAGRDVSASRDTDEVIAFSSTSPQNDAKAASQDDAGTGGDASDDPADPTPVAMNGTSTAPFTGTVEPAADDTDAYKFVVEDPANTGNSGFCVAATPLRGDDIHLDLIAPDGFVSSSDTSGFGVAEQVCAPAGHAGIGSYVAVVRTAAVSAGSLIGADATSANLASLQNYRIDPNCEPQCR